MDGRSSPSEAAEQLPAPGLDPEYPPRILYACQRNQHEFCRGYIKCSSRPKCTCLCHKPGTEEHERAQKLFRQYKKDWEVEYNKQTRTGPLVRFSAQALSGVRPNAKRPKKYKAPKDAPVEIDEEMVELIDDLCAQTGMDFSRKLLAPKVIEENERKKNERIKRYTTDYKANYRKMWWQVNYKHKITQAKYYGKCARCQRTRNPEIEVGNFCYNCYWFLWEVGRRNEIRRNLRRRVAHLFALRFGLTTRKYRRSKFIDEWAGIPGNKGQENVHVLRSPGDPFVFVDGNAVPTGCEPDYARPRMGPAGKEELSGRSYRRHQEEEVDAPKNADPFIRPGKVSVTLANGSTLRVTREPHVYTEDELAEIDCPFPPEDDGWDNAWEDDEEEADDVGADARDGGVDGQARRGSGAACQHPCPGRDQKHPGDVSRRQGVHLRDPDHRRPVVSWPGADGQKELQRRDRQAVPQRDLQLPRRSEFLGGPWTPCVRPVRKQE